MSCVVTQFTRESFGICHLRGSCSKEIELDLIYDIRHLFARLRTDGIKAMSRAFSGETTEKVCRYKKSRSYISIKKKLREFDYKIKAFSLRWLFY